MGISTTLPRTFPVSYLLPHNPTIVTRASAIKMVAFSMAVVVLLTVASTAGGQMIRKDVARMRQAEAAKRWQRGPGPAVLAPTNVKRSGVQNITFTNPKASGEFGGCSYWS